MIAFLLSPIGRYVGGAVAALAIIVSLVGAVRWYGSSQFDAGRSAERQAAVERAAELIRKRANDDAAISRMDDSVICRELGGVWVHDHCE